MSYIITKTCAVIATNLFVVQAHLASSDGEVCENTVLFVLVPRVSFEALALPVIPELEGVVKGCGQDVLAVGRELYE